MIGGTVLSRDAGQWQQVAAPGQPHNPEGKQPILCNALCRQYFFGYCVLGSHIPSGLQNVHLCFLLEIKFRKLPHVCYYKRSEHI